MNSLSYSRENGHKLETCPILVDNDLPITGDLMVQGTDIGTTTPRGDLAIRVLAMPADTNANGDIFGGWLLGQMDMAGEITVSKLSKSRCVTVAVDAMSFRKPVFVGDVVAIYVDVLHVGNTSVTVSIEAWALRREELSLVSVTQGKFTYVAIDAEGRPHAIVRQAAGQ